MSDNKNFTNLKEKIKQALNSTVRVISEDFKIENESDKNKKSLKPDFFNIDNLNSKKDFIKVRAEADSSALKIKFSDDKIHKKNLPLNSSCKSLYTIAEKIRYESLGIKMLKGIEKNLKENYKQSIDLKKQDQIKTKEDVPVTEAFELYMLKKFHNIKLSTLTDNMLKFWEKDFNDAIDEHIEFLKNNLQDQNKYSLKFSEIFEKMEIFPNEENEESKEENQNNGVDNPTNDENQSETEDKQDKNKEQETEASLDSDYDIDEYKLDEQLVDTDSDNHNNEQIITKKTLISKMKLKPL